MPKEGPADPGWLTRYKTQSYSELADRSPTTASADSEGSFNSGLERLFHATMSYHQKENRELVILNSCELVHSQFALASNYESSVTLDYLAGSRSSCYRSERQEIGPEPQSGDGIEPTYESTEFPSPESFHALHLLERF
jgi:hypothetical protein